MRRTVAARWAVALVALAAMGCTHGFSGVVRERTAAGEGAPIAGAEVAFRSADGGETHRTTTGADGRYAAELPRGRYGVSARHPVFESVESAAGEHATAPGGAIVDLALPRRTGTVVYLARHAEKADGTPNTSLSAAGLDRAAALARVLADAGLAHAFSTGLCRTAQTADPAALAAGLAIHYQLIDRPEAGLTDALCEPDIESPVEPLAGVDDEAGLAAAVLELGAGTASLVAGHLNTTPALVEALGAPSLCPETIPFDAAGRCWLPDHEYHHLFVVTVPEGDAQPSVEVYAFGLPSAPPPDP